jgi:hypothetical protein
VATGIEAPFWLVLVPPLTANPRTDKGIPFEIVEVVTQLDDLGVEYGAAGVVRSPTV